MSLRIAHLIMTRRFAGSERHAIELANAQSQDHEVTLFLAKAAVEAREDGCLQHVGPRVRVEVVGNYAGFLQARSRLARLRPDVAHAHLSRGCRALRPLRGLCLRVATLHIGYKPQQHAALDALIAIAPWQLEAVPPALRRHSVQIDNWTLPKRAAPDARARIRAANGIPADAFVIGALGRAERNKGFDLLIRAFALADLGKQAWLLVAGGGSELARLRAQAGPRVLLPGFVPNPEDWLAACDAFVSAARDEPFGLVMLEAMNAGLPIMATATKGASHLAGAIGSPLLPLDDVGALARGLRALQAGGRVRRAYPMQRFEIRAKAEEVEAFYRRELAALAYPVSDRGAAGT